MIWQALAGYLPVSVVSYLIGSISWAYLAVRVLHGDDLRVQGTGNLGARNAMRMVGPGWALAVGVGGRPWRRRQGGGRRATGPVLGRHALR